MKLRVINQPKSRPIKEAKDIEAIVCPECGERVNYAIEVVVSPVRRKYTFRWLRRGTRKALLCEHCYSQGKKIVVAE